MVAVVSFSSGVFSLNSYFFQNSSADKCLKNTKILQNIFDHVSKDSTDNLEMRVSFRRHQTRRFSIFQLVNRLFDAEYLHRIRRTHRNIKLFFVSDWSDRETREKHYIVRINERVIKHTEAAGYIKFLTDTAGVRVESLRTSGANRFRARFYRACIRFHDLVMGTLVKNRKLLSLSK